MTMENNGPVYILAIGNSFSDDATAYLHDIAAKDGVDLFVVNLCIGGCSLETHWENITQDARAYYYRLNGLSTGLQISIREALESKDWDYITFQQASIKSTDIQTYYPYIENIAEYAHKIKPQARFLIHQTWSYKTGNENLAERYRNQHDKMFADVRAAYHEAAARIGKLYNEDRSPLQIIPSGQAIEYARGIDIFNDGNEQYISLFRDDRHLTYTHGRYLAGAVWYEVFTGKSILDNSFRISDITDEELIVLKECAHMAVMEYDPV